MQYFSVDVMKLKVVAVATDETDGYKRFIHSAGTYGLDVVVCINILRIAKRVPVEHP